MSRRYRAIYGLGIGQTAHAASGRGQHASKIQSNGKDAESIVKYMGRVSARLHTHHLAEVCISTSRCRKYCKMHGPGIRQGAHAATARRQDANRTQSNVKGAESIVKYNGLGVL